MSQAPPAKPAPANATSSSRQPSSSSQAAESSDWQTVKTSGSRAKGRGQLSAQAGPRDTPAYASASPLDFQEPWRDEPESSRSSSQHSHSVGSRQQQQRQRHAVVPAVSEDELPEDWEEAAAGMAEAADAVDGTVDKVVSIGSADGPADNQVASTESLWQAGAVHTAIQAGAASDDEQQSAAADIGPVADNSVQAVDEPANASSAATHSQAEVAAAPSPTGSPAAVTATDVDSCTAIQEGDSADERQGSVLPTAEQSDAHAGQADADLAHTHDTHSTAPQSTVANELSVSESGEFTLNEGGADYHAEAHDEAREGSQSGLEASSSLNGGSQMLEQMGVGEQRAAALDQAVNLPRLQPDVLYKQFAQPELHASNGGTVHGSGLGDSQDTVADI